MVTLEQNQRIYGVIIYAHYLTQTDGNRANLVLMRIRIATTKNAEGDKTQEVQDSVTITKGVKYPTNYVLKY